MLGPCPSPASHLGGKNTQPTIFQPNLQPIPPNVQTSEPRLSGLGGVRLLRRLPSSQEDSTTRGMCSTRGRSHCRHLPCDPQPQHHGPPTGTPARLSSDGWTPLQQQATPAATKPERLTAHRHQPRHQGTPRATHCSPLPPRHQQQQATPAATKPERFTAHRCQPRHQGSPEQLTAQCRHSGPPSAASDTRPGMQALPAHCVAGGTLPHQQVATSIPAPSTASDTRPGMQALPAHPVAGGTLLNSGYGFPCNTQWCLRTSSCQRQLPWYASLASTLRC
jgi:hypothetical protein